MKFITIATLLLVSAFASAQCTNNREVNGNPCTNITTKGGFVFNGNPNSFALETQDGVTNTSTSSQGLFYLNSAGGMQTLLPIDPLFTLGYNVISPFHYPANSMQLSSGGPATFVSVGTSGPFVQGQAESIPNGSNYKSVGFYYALFGTPTSVSITIQGLSNGVYDLLDTYTGTVSTVRRVTTTVVYESFLITVGALSDGSTLTIDTPCGRGGPYPFTKLGLWSYFSGTETIDPPDANGNNTFTWNGTLSVPFTFDHCISTGGRGAGSAPVYLIGTGAGELSATPSYVGGYAEDERP